MNEQAKPSSGGVLRIVLFAVLGVLLVALAYDQLVARPTVERLKGVLEEKIEEQNAAPGDKKLVSPAQVQEILGRPPVGGMREFKDYKYEEYKFMAGLPVRSYNIVVVYQGQANPRISSVFTNKPVDIALEELHEPDQPALETPAVEMPLETGETPKARVPGEKIPSGEGGSEGEKSGDKSSEGNTKAGPDTEKPVPATPAEKSSATEPAASESGAANMK